MNIGRHTEWINDMQGEEMTVQIDVQFSRRFRVRYWIATRLILMAGWVMNVGITIEDSEATG